MQWLSKHDKINIFVPNNFDLAERRVPQMYRSGQKDHFKWFGKYFRINDH